jgi:hypothetical protein
MPEKDPGILIDPGAFAIRTTMRKRVDHPTQNSAFSGSYKSSNTAHGWAFGGRAAGARLAFEFGGCIRKRSPGVYIFGRETSSRLIDESILPSMWWPFCRVDQGLCSVLAKRQTYGRGRQSGTHCVLGCKRQTYGGGRQSGTHCVLGCKRQDAKRTVGGGKAGRIAYLVANAKTPNVRQREAKRDALRTWLQTPNVRRREAKRDALRTWLQMPNGPRLTQKRLTKVFSCPSCGAASRERLM